ncbi:cell division protein FtsZ [Hylemonella gracilis]|uniref:Cell division protein FtsZ n=1 Tax=Hylemonella gracilis TaxID=80880 RepID=A0A4V1A2D6_9BURK|nr:cell division protein ZipA C-terminal FtsZ-binding domain-containing protein [Hylemonella gracilis]QBK05679.1 cell division protein FtsZ [Hylemonella gracilis]
MSALQLGLLIAGLLVLAGVLAHGWWTARRGRPRLAEPEGQAWPYVTQPRAQATSAASLAQHAASASPVDVDAETPWHAATQDVPTEVPDRRPQHNHLDPLIDVLATIELELPISGDAVLHNLPATRRVGSKPFSVEARGEDGAWEVPQAGQQYNLLQTGVQLANRAGALNELEYSEFVLKTQALADALGGAADLPDMLDAVARARELDAFAQAHDAQLNVTLRASRTAWSAGYVQQLATRLGFVDGVLPGRMVLPRAPAPSPVLAGLPQQAVLTLHYDPQAATSADPAMTAIREVTLSLDVPQVPRAERPYERLRAVATTLAQQMDGRLGDDAGRLLVVEDLDRIGAELEALYDALEAHELPAGSGPARRLFS